MHNGTAMRGRNVQDDNQPQAAKGLGSTLVAARRVAGARKKAKLKMPKRPVVRETPALESGNNAGRCAYRHGCGREVCKTTILPK